jgi:hypothetical protein
MITVLDKSGDPLIITEDEIATLRSIDKEATMDAKHIAIAEILAAWGVVEKVTRFHLTSKGKSLLDLYLGKS